MKNVGGISGIGAPLAPDRIGGDTWIRRIGDRLIFDMHEGAGSRVRDLSGNSNDGRLTEIDSLPTWERGCLSLDGIDDYIRVPDSDSLTPDGGLTIEYHFRTPSDILSSGCYKLFEWTHYVNPNWVGLNIEDSPAPPVPGPSIGADIIPPPEYWDNEWHTFYPIWDGSTDEKNLKIYFDGLDPTLESYHFEPFRTVRNNTYNVTIGAREFPLVNFWQVRLAFFRISSTALSALEVLQEYLYNKWRN